jgi:hypothetical protein
VHGTGLGSCPMAGSADSGVKPPGSATAVEASLAANCSQNMYATCASAAVAP